MRKYNRLTKLLTTLLLCWFSTSAMSAEVVTEIESFDLVTTTAGINSGSSGSVKLLGLDPFDSSLGSLDAVEVSISGQTSSIVNSGSNYYIDPAGFPNFVPYDIFTEISFGIEGLSENYFSINPELTGRHVNTASGAGSQGALGGSYNLEFTIDADSELLGDSRPLESIGYSGGTLISFPLVSGDRADFLVSEITSDLLLLSLDVDFTATVGFPISQTSISTILAGVLQVDYIYTPSPIPAPAAVWLFGTALFGLVGFSKRRKAA